jgi:hypothetical protein
MSFDTPSRDCLTRNCSVVDALVDVKVAICSTVGAKNPI